MLGEPLLISCAIALAVPGPPVEHKDPAVGGSRARSDLNVQSDDGDYLPGRRSFYSFPRSRHVDGGGDKGRSIARQSNDRRDNSPSLDGNHGSNYYGPNYGAPYNGGGYYRGGVYYRERRD